MFHLIFCFCGESLTGASEPRAGGQLGARDVPKTDRPSFFHTGLARRTQCLQDAHVPTPHCPIFREEAGPGVVVA